MQNKHKIIVIVGSTASGKSDLAVALAKKFNGEVISADSRQVYKGLDIGTGKITKREMRGIKHHLLDVISPRSVFSAHDFVHRATKVIEDMTERGKTPIIAGGTGFYIDVLLGRLKLPDVPQDKDLRKKLETQSEKTLFKKLEKLDPKRAKDILKKNEQNNKVRLIRAIEIASSKVIEVEPLYYKGSTFIYEVLWIGIETDKEKLREKIKRRNVAMLKNGLVREVKQLRERDIAWKRLNSLGFEYSYVADFLRGKISKEEALAQMNFKTWQYARRQMTYWRRNDEIQWFKTGMKHNIVKAVKAFLGGSKKNKSIQL